MLPPKTAAKQRGTFINCHRVAKRLPSDERVGSAKQGEFYTRRGRTEIGRLSP